MSTSVMIDVDYDHFHEDRNITERSTNNGPFDANTAREAIQLLDQTYERARARLISSLTDEQAAKVPVMVPVPEHALSRVQAVLGREFQVEPDLDTNA